MGSGEGPKNSPLPCAAGRAQDAKTESMRWRDGSYHNFLHNHMRCFTDRCTIWKGKFCLCKIHVFINPSP